SSLPALLRTQPPFHFSWFSHSLGKPIPGLVSTLLNHAYSTPSREVQTFLQVMEQVWQPMHLSRFSTIAICARTFITPPPGHWQARVRRPASRSCPSSSPPPVRRGSCPRCRSS